MLQLKPLDENVPIFQQLRSRCVAGYPRQHIQRCGVRHSCATQGVGRRCQLDENAAGVYLDAIASRDCGKHGVHELRSVGIGRSF